MNEMIQDSWRRLFEKVRDWDIGLFVGAGLSADSRLPTWPDLTRDLAGREVDRRIPLSTQMGMAREVFFERGGGDAERRWIEHVRKCLYAGFVAQLEEHGLTVRDLRRRKSAGKVSDFFQKTNPAVAEVVRMCKVRKGGIPRVVAVLSTNLDSLLQICDRAMNGKRRRLRTIERATKASDVRKTSLYHLHGYLRPQENSKAKKEAADRLVLTEFDYTKRNDNPGHWAATTLHLALREFPVVFLGCSMNDELIRRALYRTREHRIADARAERSAKRLQRHSKPKHFAVCKWQAGEEEANLALAESYRLMDVNPLWISDYPKLSSWLETLRRELS